MSVKHFIWAKIIVSYSQLVNFKIRQTLASSREKRMLYFIEQRLLVWQLYKVSDPLVSTRTTSNGKTTAEILQKNIFYYTLEKVWSSTLFPQNPDKALLNAVACCEKHSTYFYLVPHFGNFKALSEVDSCNYLWSNELTIRNVFLLFRSFFLSNYKMQVKTSNNLKTFEMDCDFRAEVYLANQPRRCVCLPESLAMQTK